MLPRPEEIEQLCDRWRTISRTNDRQAVQAELERVLASAQFRASHRGQAFLTHVIEKALAGEFDTLKERLVGVELFGRDSQFDTDRDSVVRVAANDVRRRLQEFYRAHPPARIRIGLRSGTYIPTIESGSTEAAPPVFAEPAPSAPAVVAPAVVLQPPQPPQPANRWRILAIAALASTAALSIWIAARPTAASAAPAHAPFWSSILKPGKRASIVMADANLVMRKIRVPRDVPIDTYSGHNFEYLTDFPGPFGGYLNNIPLTTVSDAMLASRIASLSSRFGSELHVKGCRRLQLADLKREEPIIFLGSTMSDPWVELLHDQLNFKIVHRFDTGIDVCINSSPRPGELSEYAPRREPPGVFVGYALVALVANLAGNAPVLLIAGTSTEGTEAAGEFVTDLDRLDTALQKAGVSPNSAPKHVEFVIRTSYMSATSAKAEVIASRVE